MSPFHFLKLHLNVIRIYATVFLVAFFPLVSPPKPCVHLSPINATCPTHLILHLIIRKILCEQYRSLSSSLRSFSPFPYYIIPIRPNYSLQHPILKSAKPTFLPQRERPSFTPIHHNREFIVFILIFKFLDSKLEDKNSAPNDSNHSLASICS